MSWSAEGASYTAVDVGSIGGSSSRIGDIGLRHRTEPYICRMYCMCMYVPCTVGTARCASLARCGHGRRTALGGRDRYRVPSTERDARLARNVGKKQSYRPTYSCSLYVSRLWTRRTAVEDPQRWGQRRASRHPRASSLTNVRNGSQLAKNRSKCAARMRMRALRRLRSLSGAGTRQACQPSARARYAPPSAP